MTALRRRRTLLHISLLMAMGRRPHAYRVAKRALAEDSCSARQLAELYLHLSLLLGVPAALEALAGLHRTSQTWHLTPHNGSRSSGLRTFRRIYGNQTDAVLRSMRSIDPVLPDWIIRDVYGAVYARRGLSTADREVVTFGVLAYQGFDPQCHSHLRGAKRLGIPLSEIHHHLRLVQRLTRRSTRRFQQWITKA